MRPVVEIKVTLEDQLRFTCLHDPGPRHCVSGSRINPDKWSVGGSWLLTQVLTHGRAWVNGGKLSTYLRIFLSRFMGNTAVSACSSTSEDPSIFVVIYNSTFSDLRYFIYLLDI